MQMQASAILADFVDQGILDSLQGPDTLVSNIVNVERGGAGALVFVDSPDFVTAALKAEPAAIVTHADLAEQFSGLKQTAILISTNVRLAQALLRQAYVDRDVRNTGWPQIHSSAVVHESALVPDDAVIGPGAVISADVKLGARVVIMANSVIEQGAIIGDETVIHSNVVVGYHCEIGARCIIKSATVIGMEGFGFAQDSQRKSHRLPQLGKVIIGNDVVVGSSCTIDRAAYDETRIGDGCKLDTQVHIAHGVEIGEDCLLCSQTSIAGSTKIGNRVICSGQTGVLDHLSVCDDVVLVQRAGVIKNITEPGMYAGTPAQPARQYFKNAASAARLSELKKQVNELERQVNASAAPNEKH